MTNLENNFVTSMDTNNKSDNQSSLSSHSFLYDDLPLFDVNSVSSVEKKQLIEKFENEIDELKNMIQIQNQQIERLTMEKEILTKNIIALLKTAQAEILRKNGQIEEMRKKILHFMGFCKCRHNTTLYCFEHRKNVCDNCCMTDHERCIIQPYVKWLQNGDVKRICSICHQGLDDSKGVIRSPTEKLSENNPPLVRLLCYDLVHLDCLNIYINSKLEPDQVKGLHDANGILGDLSALSSLPSSSIQLIETPLPLHKSQSESNDRTILVTILCPSCKSSPIFPEMTPPLKKSFLLDKLKDQLKPFVWAKFFIENIERLYSSVSTSNNSETISISNSSLNKQMVDKSMYEGRQGGNELVIQMNIASHPYATLPTLLSEKSSSSVLAYQLKKENHRVFSKITQYLPQNLFRIRTLSGFSSIKRFIILFIFSSVAVMVWIFSELR